MTHIGTGAVMEKVRLGRTNLLVTRLGWGGIPIQRVSEEEGVRVIEFLIDVGVDFLDTARGYTNSERRVGLALQKTDRPVVISTKSQVRTEKIYEEVQRSLREMQVKKISVYHLHAVNNFQDYEKVMGAGMAYQGLKRAQEDGLIDYIGLTSHNLKVLEKVVEDGYVDVIMACYSFLESDAAQRVFPLAKARNIGMLAMKPFSGGVIEKAGPALRFVLSTPGIVPIPGAESLEKARENWEIFTKSHALTEEDETYIEILRKEMNQQFCRRCDYCQPCSANISIQHVLGLKTLAKRFGPATEELEWFRSLLEKARNCSECGECLPRCPYALPIPKLIRENLAWYDRWLEENRIKPVQL